MLVISENQGVSTSYRAVAQQPDLQSAIDYVNSNYRVSFLEIDEDHENCADFLTSDGIIGKIEPDNFKMV